MNEIEHWLYNDCPWGICESNNRSEHTYCKEVLRAQLKKFVEDKYPTPIDPEFEFDKWMDFMDKWRQDHPTDTMMDNGARIYNWRAVRLDLNKWRIDVGY